jgi:hypothetical protein
MSTLRIELRQVDGGIAVGLISVFVAYQMWQVFQFDFSTYQFNWGVLVRVLLVLTMVGAGVGVLTEASKVASGELTERR